MEEHCVICGEIIPEGRQICPKCEKRKWDNGQRDHNTSTDCEVSASTK